MCEHRCLKELICSVYNMRRQQNATATARHLLVSPPLAFVSPPLAFVSPPLAFVSPPLAFVSPPLAFVSPPQPLKYPFLDTHSEGPDVTLLPLLCQYSFIVTFSPFCPITIWPSSGEHSSRAPITPPRPVSGPSCGAQRGLREAPGRSGRRQRRQRRQRWTTVIATRLLPS